jgi:hypothetical protein
VDQLTPPWLKKYTGVLDMDAVCVVGEEADTECRAANIFAAKSGTDMGERKMANATIAAAVEINRLASPYMATLCCWPWLSRARFAIEMVKELTSNYKTRPEMSGVGIINWRAAIKYRFTGGALMTQRLLSLECRFVPINQCRLFVSSRYQRFG